MPRRFSPPTLGRQAASRRPTTSDGCMHLYTQKKEKNRVVEPSDSESKPRPQIRILLGLASARDEIRICSQEANTTTPKKKTLQKKKKKERGQDIPIQRVKTTVYSSSQQPPFDLFQR